MQYNKKFNIILQKSIYNKDYLIILIIVNE